MHRALALLFAVGLLLSGLPAPAPVSADERLVLAFYYNWYEMGDWSADRMPYLPTQRYSGGDPATQRRHLDQAARARIDGLIHSWWGPGDRTDDRLGEMLALAAKGSPVRMSVYIETGSDRLSSRGAMVNGLRHLLGRHAGHPSFVRYRGKPVIFIWQPNAVARDPGVSANDAWRSILDEVDPGRNVIWSAEGVDLGLLDIFDGLHQFGAALWAADPGASDRTFRARIDAYNAARGTAKIWAAGVAPGHDDTRLGRARPVYVERQDGAYYRRSFGGAISSNPEWITITSFNEWFEGTQIEPSPAYGDLYLNLTREFVDAYKGPLLDGSPAAAFDRVWSRADALVAAQATSRAWLWGPGGFDERTEPYAESPDGQRTVRYYDKARMEVTRPGADPAAPGFVTNGLLVRELIAGRVQTGDDRFERARPARIPAAGDPDAGDPITYADLAELASLNGDKRAENATGAPVVDRFYPGENVSPDGELGRYGVTLALYEPALGHNIANVFWDAFNAAGPIVDPRTGRRETGPIIDWRTDVGLPLMEPVWVHATVGGQRQDVLLQCFERRCLTYTPANEPEWRVEMGNVGRHYHAWRYGG